MALMLQKDDVLTMCHTSPWQQIPSSALSNQPCSRLLEQGIHQNAGPSCMTWTPRSRGQALCGMITRMWHSADAHQCCRDWINPCVGPADIWSQCRSFCACTTSSPPSDQGPGFYWISNQLLQHHPADTERSQLGQASRATCVQSICLMPVARLTCNVPL